MLTPHDRQSCAVKQKSHLIRSDTARETRASAEKNKMLLNAVAPSSMTAKNERYASDGI